MSQAISPLPVSEQLAVAGLVFDQLAGVVNRRATLLLESWESWHRPTDPVLDFSRDPDLFVQSQRLELSELVDTTPEPVFYPFERKSPTSPDSAFDEGEGSSGDDLSAGLSDLFPAGVDAHVPVVNLEAADAATEAEVMASISPCHTVRISRCGRLKSQRLCVHSLRANDTRSQPCRYWPCSRRYKCR